MECQKIINLLDKTQNEPAKFRTRNWVEINDERNKEVIFRNCAPFTECTSNINNT